MDGTPHAVRFDATTLWHLDAAEWAPSTASKAERLAVSIFRPDYPRICCKTRLRFAARARLCVFADTALPLGHRQHRRLNATVTPGKQRRPAVGLGRAT